MWPRLLSAAVFNHLFFISRHKLKALLAAGLDSFTDCMIIFVFQHPSSKNTAADSQPVPQISECFLQTVSKWSREPRKRSRTVRGVNPQVDGDGRDAFVGPRDPIRLRLDLLADLIEVCELFPLAVKKLGPF